MAPVAALNRGEFALLELALPGSEVRPIGVLLFDPASDRLYVRLREEWSGVEPDDLAVLALLERDLDSKARELGGAALLGWLEDTLSNTLRITGRQSVSVASFARTLDNLFAQHVPEARRIPLYSLRSAAGPFGAEQSVEPEGWVAAPPGVRWNESLFAARVVGRSMEPLIPEGSLCLFRHGVTGSRQGKLVLVEEEGALGSSARYTVKRYASEKRSSSEDQWRHESIRLEPLNPEFEAFDLSADPDRYRIVAEFLQVLE